MQPSPYAARQQARWITENASRFIRPDAARFYKPGTRMEDVFPALALKYNPNQPRVPAGNSDGGQWTDGEGGAARLAQPMGNIGITDRRVMSDSDPESVKPGEQYAQARGGRGPTRVSIGGQTYELTPAQSARIAIVEARANEAIARVREIDPTWKPQPSLYQTPEGLIRSHEATTAEARERLDLLVGTVVPGRYAGGSIPAPIGRRLSESEQRELNYYMSENGCHRCGQRDPSTRSGNAIGDHQEPTALNPAGVAQRLFPHCLTCSRIQGGVVSGIVGRMNR